MRRIARYLRYISWIIYGYFGWKINLNTPKKVLVLITYYNPARIIHINHQVRNILKCGFVDKIIISNHNPDLKLDEMMNINSERVITINQLTRRGCGYRWYIAETYAPEYLIVIDDDMRLFPGQLAKLFRCLINEPEIPHGISGMFILENESFVFTEKKNIDVDFLCEVYAVTGKHLKRYMELIRLIANGNTITTHIEYAADFMIISKTGIRKPKIHKVGRISRSSTYNDVGIAIHKEKGFTKSMQEIHRALSHVRG
jgi:cellulose synthase/poly-beta-1,6-N-acetylglucosamine synthase-like glycosyltransferase